MRKPIIVLAALGILATSACSTDTSAPPAASTVTSSSAAPAPNSEAALRERLGEFHDTVLRPQDWGKTYDFLSPRCQELADAYGGRQPIIEEGKSRAANKGGRDFSGDSEYLITMKGDTATVVTKSPDGKGDMTPEPWLFLNGEWWSDGCTGSAPAVQAPAPAVTRQPAPTVDSGPAFPGDEYLPMETYTPDADVPPANLCDADGDGFCDGDGSPVG